MIYWARLTHPEYGYPNDKDNVKELNENQYYKVEDVQIGQSVSYAKLKGITHLINTVQLDFYDDNMKPIDILQTDYNMYLHMYNKGDKT